MTSVGSKISRSRIWETGEVGSALDVAWEMIATGKMACWDSVLAKSQTHGRGQLRRYWQSPPGNIYAALRLPREYPFDCPGASVAVSGLFCRAFLENGIHVMIKWPNDIVYVVNGQPKKLAGILLEERGNTLLAGIGINVCWAPPDHAMRENAAMPATTVSEIFPEYPASSNLTLFWSRIVNCMYSEYVSKLFKEQWPGVVSHTLLWLGQEVELSDGRESVTGTFRGISMDGAVCISCNGHAVVRHSGSLRVLE